MRKVSYLAAIYRPRTNSFAVHEFPEGEAFNWELQDHIFMANEKIMKLGGGFLPLGYGSVEYFCESDKEKAFDEFYQTAIDKLNSVQPIPPCDVPSYDDWSDNKYDM